MGYKKFLGMGYEKFLGIAVGIFTGFSWERFLGISADSWERLLEISADFPQNCYLGYIKTVDRVDFEMSRHLAFYSFNS